MLAEPVKRIGEWYVLEEGPMGRVVVSEAAYDEYQKLVAGRDNRLVAQRTALKKYLGRFCTHPDHLNDQQFKKEQDVQDSQGGKIAIWAFKPFAWRLYGAVFDYEGKRTFWGSLVDPSKKQDKADREKLKRAGLIVASSNEYQVYHRRRRENDDEKKRRRSR